MVFSQAGQVRAKGPCFPEWRDLGPRSWQQGREAANWETHGHRLQHSRHEPSRPEPSLDYTWGTKSSETPRLKSPHGGGQWPSQDTVWPSDLRPVRLHPKLLHFVTSPRNLDTSLKMAMMHFPPAQQEWVSSKKWSC